MLHEFKTFILRGNVVDLAVGVIIGVAFGGVVTAFTDGVLMAAVAGVLGEPNFDRVVVGLGDGQLLVGALLTAIVNLALVGAALFLVVRAVNSLQDREQKQAAEQAAQAAQPTPSDEAMLLVEIRDLLRSLQG